MSKRSFPLLLALAAFAGSVAVSGCASPPEVRPLPPAAPPDTDGDGIADPWDHCPEEKEDGLAPVKDDGCASSDRDGDGIANADDKCPDEKEDGLAPDPNDGCPTTDRDGDGIANADDKCPDEKETVNGFEDEDGCPDEAPRVVVTKDEVRIKEKILFATNLATIDPQSNDLLKNIADVINENPKIEFIEVAGHADKRGDAKRNVLLTKSRAEAVRRALARYGVDARRLQAQGYGAYCPIDDAENEEAYEKNRRVEFKIMRISGKETGVTTGCAEAQSQGIKLTEIPKTAPTQEALEKALAKKKQ